MTLIFESNLRKPAGSGGTHIAMALASGWKSLRRAIAVRRTRRSLEGLPDWILRDIGISRGEIQHLSTVANDPAREDDDRSWRFLS